MATYPAERTYTSPELTAALAGSLDFSGYYRSYFTYGTTSREEAQGIIDRERGLTPSGSARVWSAWRSAVINAAIAGDTRAKDTCAVLQRRGDFNGLSDVERAKALA